MSKTKVENVNNVHPFSQRRKKKIRWNRVKSCEVKLRPCSTPSLQTENGLVLPPDMKPFQNQVAGHVFEQGKSCGMLKYKREFVLKPVMKPICAEREKLFYEELQKTTDPVLLELKKFVPRYHGTKVVNFSGQDVPCLILDDLTVGLKEPCIMDIKIGRRTWDPFMDPEKIQLHINKYTESKRDVAFCIPGFQVRRISDGNLYKFGKDYGKKLNGESVKEALKIFLNGDSGLCRALLVQLLSVLWRILIWCRSQTKLRLYSSSLLLVYDARVLQKIMKNNNEVLSSRSLSPTRYKHVRPLSLAINDVKNDNSPLLSPGFSGQLTPEGPKFERSLSANAGDISPSSPVNINCPWKKSLRKIQRTHSFTNNYEEELQNLKQRYVNILDNLVDDSPNIWANVKMIDFAHVFPAETNTLDTNYLEGIENLVKIFEEFLQNSC